MRVEGRIVKYGVRKTVRERQAALNELVKAIREFRKFTDQPPRFEVRIMQRLSMHAGCVLLYLRIEKSTGTNCCKTGTNDQNQSPGDTANEEVARGVEDLVRRETWSPRRACASAWITAPNRDRITERSAEPDRGADSHDS